MAVAVLDAIADTGATSTGSAGSFAVSSGSDRLLVYATLATTADSITAVSYGGQPMSAGPVIAGTTNAIFLRIFTLDEAGIVAASGTGFSVTGSAGGRYRALAGSLSGVDQTSPIVDSGTQNGDLSSGTISLAVEDEGFIVAFANGVTSTLYDWTGLTEGFGVEGDSTMSYSSATVATTAVTPFAVDVDINGSSDNPTSTTRRCAAAVSFAPATATGSRATGDIVFNGAANAEELPETTTGLDGGARRVFINKAGNDSNDGLSRANAKLTLQGGLSVAQPGDVVTMGAGHYFETPSRSGIAGTASAPVWIVAERRGTVTVSNYWQDAYEGTQVWDDEGGGTYSAVHGSVYSGSHDGDFLFRYQSQADLEAASLSISGSVAGGTNVVAKPQYGFAEEGGRIYVRLRNGVDPTGQKVKLTDAFSQSIVTLTNCDHVYFDGINFEGAGDTSAISFDAASDNPIIRNCKADHSRFLATVSSNFLIEWCEYTFEGFASWMRELVALDGLGNAGIFDINKNYNVSSGNTFYEGGIIAGTSSTDQNGEIRFNWIHGVFEGMRAGEHDNVDIHDNVIEDIGDNAIEFESFRSSDASANIRFFHNLVMQVHDACTSHQPGNDFQGPHHIFGNVMICDDLTLSGPRFMIKTINAATNTNDPEINYYNNYFRARRGTTVLSSPDGQSSIWGQSFSTDDAEEIDRFVNNVAVYQDGLDDGGQANPSSIQTNILAAPSDNADFQQNGGLRVANEAALLLGANLQPLTGSPLIGAGTTLPGSLPTVAGTSDQDVGPFEDGFDPGSDWPRVRATVFDDTPPGIFNTSSASGLIDISGSANATKLALAQATGLIDFAGVADPVVLVPASASGLIDVAGNADAIKLALVQASGLIDIAGSATADEFSGSRATGAIVFGGRANASEPIPVIPQLPIEDSFVTQQSPVILIDLFFDEAELNIWSRPFEGIFAFKDYQPLAGVNSGVTVRNSLDSSTLEASIQLSGQSDELLAIALTERYQGRLADVMVGNIGSDGDIEAVEILISGVMVNMTVTDDDESSTVSIVIESIFRNLQRSDILRQSTADLSLTSADDSFFEHLAGTRIRTPSFGSNDT